MSTDLQTVEAQPLRLEQISPLGALMFVTEFQSNVTSFRVQYVKKGPKLPQQPEYMRRCGAVISFIAANGIPYVGWSLCDKADRENDLFTEEVALYIAIHHALPINYYVGADPAAIYPDSLKYHIADMVKRVFGDLVKKVMLM